MAKDKLIELLQQFEIPIMFGDIELMKWSIPTPGILTDLVDYLVDNGVEIPVLCEDCDHLRHSEDGTFCAITWTDVDNDDFCSFGRSREERNTR